MPTIIIICADAYRKENRRWTMSDIGLFDSNCLCSPSTDTPNTLHFRERNAVRVSVLLFRIPKNAFKYKIRFYFLIENLGVLFAFHFISFYPELVNVARMLVVVGRTDSACTTTDVDSKQCNVVSATYTEPLFQLAKMVESKLCSTQTKQA